MVEIGGTAEADVLLRVVTPEGDAEELSESVALLRDYLLDLDVDAVGLLPGDEIPESSKGAVAVVAGWLAVKLGPAALHAVVDRVSAWAGRSNRTVEITIGTDVLKVSGVTTDQQTRLIDDWISRHTQSS